MSRTTKVLYWLPMILLPACNLLMLFFAPLSFDSRTLLLSLIGAVVEELFFRLFLLKTTFLPRMTPVLAIILVSVLFAALHLLNLRNGTPLHDIPPQMFCAFCFSIWAGAVVWRKGSILIPLLTHVLLNITSLTSMPWLPCLAMSTILLIDGILLLKSR